MTPVGITPKKDENAGQSKFVREITRVAKAGYGICYIQTQEEERALNDLQQVSVNLKSSFFTWDIEGQLKFYSPENPQSQGTNSIAVKDLKLFYQLTDGSFGEKTIFAILDFKDAIKGPGVIRSIKNSLAALRRDGKLACIVGPEIKIPPELEKEVYVARFPLPSKDDLKMYFRFAIDSAVETINAKGGPHMDPKKVLAGIGTEIEEAMADAALGLSAPEAEGAYALAVATEGKVSVTEDSIKTVLDAKCEALKKDGMLEYFPAEESLATLGGYDLLKLYVTQRRRAFSSTARQFGIPTPKGLLLFGVQGCGKSLTAKAIAATWGVPCLRADAGKIYGKFVGESEGNIKRILEQADLMAPCVLWIDELEKAFSGMGAGSELSGGGVTAKVGGIFLTWLAEHKSSVYVIATANDIEKLPPELYRKGRFDEIFFIDLPNPKEREEIVKIHLEKRNVPRRVAGLKSFELTDEEVKKIAVAANEFSGSEIEQAIIAAAYVGFEDGGRLIGGDDVLKQIADTKPLAVTAKEKIQELRNWGKAQVRPASSRTGLTSTGEVLPDFLQKKPARRIG